MTIIEKEIDKIGYIIFEKHHILLFIITIWLLLYLSQFSFFLNRSINIYQVAAFSAAYNYMNTNLTVYNLLMSAFLSSFISYFIYQLLYKHIYTLILNAIITLFVILFTDLTNCFNISSLIYAMICIKEIPRMKTGYLFSYFLACLAIICFYSIYTKIIVLIQNHFHQLLDYKFEVKKWY
jgi:hypothetical protein